MPRQKNNARPVNNKVPAAAADGRKPPMANEEKLYINLLKQFFQILSTI